MPTKLPPGREPPPSVRKVPSEVTTVDLATGETTTKPMDWSLMPPAAHKCQVCAAEHDPLTAHNAQSLYYQYAFYGANGQRWPTWADAVAHCAPELRAAWKHHLQNHESGNQWTEPPPGVEPVAHLGPGTPSSVTRKGDAGKDEAGEGKDA